MRKTNQTENLRQKRVICVPCDLKKHQAIVKNASLYRQFLDQIIKSSPELFPPEIKEGYLMKDLRYSSKLKVYQRRILDLYDKTLLCNAIYDGFNRPS